MNTINSKIESAFLGQAIGDALGVPVEFKSRTYLKENPVTDYLGFLCWNQPPGTFSDDSSMMFCTAESLSKGYDLEDISSKFVKWYQEGYWGAHHELFDIGGTTRRSLDRIIQGESPKFSGEFFPENNGNGSLMRILPLVFYLKNESDIEKRYQIIKEVSSITHAHFRAVFSCFIFVEFGIELLHNDKFSALENMRVTIKNFAQKQEFNANEIKLFDRVLSGDITKIKEEELSSEGYVLDSLESAFWCLMTTNTYKDSVLKSVNLGGDTDTTGAINGGLAGIHYGLDTIPQNWILGIARLEDIRKLSLDFSNSLMK